MFVETVKFIDRIVSGYCARSRDVKKKIARLVSEEGNTLDRYGFIQGTDKASVVPDISLLRLSHDYLRHYDFVLNPFRNDKFNLLEFGCAGGASLRMWKKYFQNSEIYGVDLDENAKNLEEERVHIIIGNATSKNTFDEIKDKIGSAFVILDDASHAWGDQRRSFELFWEMVSPGGFYIIEDLESGTKGATPYPPEVLDSQPFYEYMHDRSKILRWAPDREPEQNSYHFEQLPERIQKIEREMDMCMFVPGAIIVRKKY